jgi:riboflavin transporter FmnP
MTTLPASVTDRTRSTKPATSSFDVGTVLHTVATVINVAHAFLLPLGALLAGLFALGLDVTGIFYGASGSLLRGALILVGIWLVLWAVKAGIRAVAEILPSHRFHELFNTNGATETAGTVTTASTEVARPKLALPKDSPAPRFGATLDS